MSAHAHSPLEDEAMGFAGATPIRLPQLAARGYCVPVGRKRVLVLQPGGAEVAADALRRSGPQVLGICGGVTDLDKARRQLERAYERPLAGYRGLLGSAYLAPTQDDLGLLVEFHALSGVAAAKPCSG